MIAYLRKGLGRWWLFWLIVYGSLCLCSGALVLLYIALCTGPLHPLN